MKRARRTTLRTAVAAAFATAVAAAAAIGPSAAAAQPAWPAKPIRLVVPAFVGTPIDIVSRAVANRLATELGQPVVVDNRPSAGGIVGAQEVLKHPADGYTLMTLFMPMTVGQSVFRSVSYDLRRDFAPIAQTVWSYNVLVVPPTLPAKSVAELVALAKARPGQLNFASGGIGSPAHIAGLLLGQQTGASATHVPYNAFPQAIGDLMSGQVQFMFAATPPVVAHIGSGKLRPLAVTGPQRIPALQDVPTMVEAGFPDFVLRDWQGVVARAGTPKEIVDRVHAAVQKAIASDELRKTLATLGAEPAPGSAAEFGAHVAREVDAWAKVVRTANISAD